MEEVRLSMDLAYLIWESLIPCHRQVPSKFFVIFYMLYSGPSIFRCALTSEPQGKCEGGKN